MSRPDALLRRLPVHWESWASLTIGLLLVPVGAYLISRAAVDASIAPGVAGVVLLLVSFPLIALSAPEVLRPPQLHEWTLVLPRTFHRSVRIPLAEISGVGLVYDIGAVRRGWLLRVWTLDGGSYGVDSVRSYVRGARHPELGEPAYRVPRRKRPRLDWTAIAASPAARAAAEIDQRCRLVQGPAGPLATLAEQCSGPSYGIYLAFWSADGRIGWLGAREARARERARDDVASDEFSGDDLGDYPEDDPEFDDGT